MLHNRNKPVDEICTRQPVFETRFNDFLAGLENHLKAGEKDVLKQLVHETIFEADPDRNRCRIFLATLHDLFTAYQVRLQEKLL